MLVTLKEILDDAKKRSYGVGMFGSFNMEMINGIIAAAEETSSPVIVSTGPGELCFNPIRLTAPYLVQKAKEAKVPVCVHFDHGDTFEDVAEAIRCGFSSVMMDASSLSYADNVAATKEIVKMAHALGVSVEGEIGHVGGQEGGMYAEKTREDCYTTTQDAINYVQDTGVDALAVAIGTAHGQYTFTPKLDFDRLTDIRDAVDVPLVLHGGSGLSDDDFKKSIALGIHKVNVFTDVCNAGLRTMREHEGQEISYLDLSIKIKEGIKAQVMDKMAIFGSVNKA